MIYNGENDKKDDQALDELEEDLKKEHQEKRKLPMPVSGRSVFNIKRIKDEFKDRK